MVNSKQLSQSALFIALLFISGKIKIPIGAVPITLQLLVVVVMGLVLDKKQIVFILLSYIILGLIGIPIFSNGGGIMYLLQPTFGFIIGFIFLALAINVIKPVLLGMIVGYVLLYVVGIVWFILVSLFVFQVDVSVSYVLLVVWLPFVITDLLSMVVGWRVSKMLAQRVQALSTTIK